MEERRKRDIISRERKEDLFQYLIM